MEKARHVTATAVAMQLSSGLDGEGFAPAHAWALAQPLRFAADWRGENPDLARQTEVRLLWTNENLYLRFRCNYRTLTIFADGDANGRRDQLWDRDVAEVFCKPMPASRATTGNSKSVPTDFGLIWKFL